MDEAACRRVLEVEAEVSMEEIAHAYQRMKRFYENELAVHAAPSMDEFSAESRAEVLAEIEAAYAELVRLHEAAQPVIQVKPITLPARDLPHDGPGLRALREAQNIPLEYVASQSNVRLEHLKALEEERFADLPPAAVNVRGFLAAYATTIGLPADEVVPLYMGRFLQWQSRRGR